MLRVLRMLTVPCRSCDSGAGEQPAGAALTRHRQEGAHRGQLLRLRGPARHQVSCDWSAARYTHL